MNPLRFPLSWQILLAMLLATIVGYILPYTAQAVGGIGDLYVKLLCLTLVPAIIPNIINGVASITKSGLLGRLTLKNLSWFIVSQFVAVCTIFFIATFAGIGYGVNLFEHQTENLFFKPEHNFGDFIINIFPESFFNALEINNISAIFIFCVIFGYFTSKSSDKTRIFIKNMSSSFSEIMQQFTTFTAKLAPIGVFCIIAQTVAETDFVSNVYKFLPFITAVAAAMAIHSFISLPIAFKFLTGQSAFKLIKMFGSVLYTAFAVRSSYAVVPQIMQRMKKEVGIQARISDFLVPMGALTHNNGGAIYFCATAIFVSQAYGIEMSIFEQIAIFLAVSFITLGITDIPLAGAAAILPVLEALGLPKEGFAIIITFDTIICMSAAFVDTWSNICATSTIAYSEGETLTINNEQLKIEN